MSAPTKTDPELGAQIKERLQTYSDNGPILDGIPDPNKRKYLEELMNQFLQELGIDIRHPSTADTARRVARMFVEELCYGMDFNNFPAMQIDEVSVKHADEIVLIRDIEVHSMCEHHLVPIVGRCHIAYIPNGKILGLSKFNRVVDFFSRRPQLQERLTEQVSAGLQYILATPNVAVIVEAEHFCTRYRGVEDPCSDTVTSKMSGVFKSKPEARQELLALIALKRRD